MTWDQYSNDPEQNRIAQEFEQLNFRYSRKPGFKAQPEEIGIEEVAQPLLAFHGKVQDANRGKNLIFNRKPLYKNAFEGRKATHILFTYALARAIDERRIELKRKSTEGSIITIEQEQLSLFRSLRFKSFFIAVMARCLEAILGRKVDAETIGFSNAAASENTLYALVAAWSPIVETVLSFVTTRMNLSQFAERSGEEALVDETARDVGAILYVSKKSLPLSSFNSMVMSTNGSSDAAVHRPALES
jgi:hypothetical protein